MVTDDLTESVRIDRIGHRGDGIGASQSGPVYVPFALAGEQLTIIRDSHEKSRARLISVDEASLERVQPLCRYFGPQAPVPCGGCALQMMSLEANRDLKRQFVIDALAGQGIDIKVDETLGTRPGERRRTVLSARKTSTGILLGYHQRGSNRIIDIAECPVLDARISDRLGGLRTIIDVLGLERGPARLSVLATDTGLDVDIAGDDRNSIFGALADASRQPRLFTLCRQSDIARLTVAGELVVKLAEPQIRIGDVSVAPQPAAFAQASAGAETAMTGLALEHLAGCRTVIDLFSGIGTFALALARFSRVHAVEVDGTALDVLDVAVRHADGLKPVTTERRDIMRFPLSTAELAGFSGLVFDPPRAGARAQAAEIAGSDASRIVAVSCNPATFARDARILLDGGFMMQRVVPVDQFVYSAETEIIGLFSR